MLDLKAKLAAAGLVTPADVAAAERKQKRNSGPEGREARGPQGRDARGPEGRDARGPEGRDARGPEGRDARGPGGREAKGPPRPAPKPEARAPGHGLDLPALRKAGKGAAYDAIRRAVERARLDGAAPTAAAGPFHFTTAAGQLSRLILEPPVQQALTAGAAGITAFMSHHGLAHAVVPRPLAEAIAELFPLWLRTLQDHPGAGQIEPRPPKTPQAAPDAGPPALPDPAPGPAPDETT